VSITVADQKPLYPCHSNNQNYRAYKTL